MRCSKDFSWERDEGKTRIVKEPIGVCGFITPWNWPVNQIMCKVAPALASGCTMVLKPSEVAPLDAIIIAARAELDAVKRNVTKATLADSERHQGNAVGVSGRPLRVGINARAQVIAVAAFDVIAAHFPVLVGHGCHPIRQRT